MRCKHCGEEIAGQYQGRLHATGPQTGLQRCATKPYGYNAEPEGTDCHIPCRGQYVSDEKIEVVR